MFMELDLRIKLMLKSFNYIDTEITDHKFMLLIF